MTCTSLAKYLPYATVDDDEEDYDTVTVVDQNIVDLQQRFIREHFNYALSLWWKILKFAHEWRIVSLLVNDVT